jgi:hypothetical protein
MRFWQMTEYVGIQIYVVMYVYSYVGIYCIYIYVYEGRDSLAGIATRYELESPGIESRWGREFPHLSEPALGPTQPPIQ